MPTTVIAFGATAASSPVSRMSIQRRDVGLRDVQIDITHCGICHSDLHQVRSQWAGTVYPCVPGHEIVGRVASVGSGVSKHKPGDLVGVGCMVDSCRSCPDCKEGLEQYCFGFPTFTYNGVDKHLGGVTLGGYAKQIVVDEHFVLKMPSTLNPAGAAPLLCAGITTYSPLKHWGVSSGSTVGIVGLGGLGHMGVKFSRAMGARTVVFTTSSKKIEDAKRLGAHDVVLSNDDAAMGKLARSCDFILDTVGNAHNLDAYTNLLKRDGTLCLVGAPEHPHPSPAVWPLLLGRRRIAGSAIGGIAQTQEMLDFCGKHGITSDVEVIGPEQIESAYERMLKSDVKYRFVIEMNRA
jgi:alcohol dehydrogenase (NADP+)